WHVVQRQRAEAFSPDNNSGRLLLQNISYRNWFHRRMETKLPATTINGTTDSASLLFPKAAQALYHRSETLCYLLLLRFRDQAKNRENGLRFPANGISHVIGCILEQPSQILSVTCGRNTFQERR